MKHTIEAILLLSLFNLSFMLQAQEDITEFQNVSYSKISEIYDAQDKLKGYYMFFEYDKKAFDERTYGVDILDLNLESVGRRNLTPDQKPQDVFVLNNTIISKGFQDGSISMNGYRIDSEESWSSDFDGKAVTFGHVYETFVSHYDKGLYFITDYYGVEHMDRDGNTKRILDWGDFKDEYFKFKFRSAEINGDYLFLYGESKGNVKNLIVYDLVNEDIAHTIELEMYSGFRISNCKVLKDGRVVAVFYKTPSSPHYKYFIYDSDSNNLTVSETIELKRSSVTEKNFDGLSQYDLNTVIYEDGSATSFLYADSGLGLFGSESISFTDFCVIEFNGKAAKGKSLDHIDYKEENKYFEYTTIRDLPFQAVKFYPEIKSTTAVLVSKGLKSGMPKKFGNNILIYKVKDETSVKFKLPYSENADDVLVFDAKPGFIAVFEYFKKDKNVSFELKKIPQL